MLNLQKVFLVAEKIKAIIFVFYYGT